jgi:hypothetical protein
MKRYLLAFLLATVSASAWAAISADTVWEVRSTNGADTNGGGFVPGQGATDVSGGTDLAIDAASNTVVTSASHNFVAADVGKYLAITAGTDWNLGYFNILSTATNAATLDRTPGAVGLTGGTYTLYSAIDYSQQNAKNTTGNNISVTDVTADNSTTIVSATASFTPAVTGNIVYLAGGSGSLTGGWYQATYATATGLTVDRVVATGTGITMNVGGALQTIQTLATNTATGNKAFIKNEASYIATATVQFPNAYTTLVGYGSNRSDNLKPTILASTATGFAVVHTAGGASEVRNLLVDCASLTGTTGIQLLQTSLADNNEVKNYGLYGIRGIASSNASSNIFTRNNVYGGVSTSGIGISNSIGTGAVSGVFYDNYVHDGNGAGIADTAGPSSFLFNVVNNMAGGTAYGIYSNAWSAIYGNVVNNTGASCISTANSTSNFALEKNNILTNCGGNGLLAVTTTIRPSFARDGNAFYATASGNLGNITNLAGNLGVAPYVYTKNITTASSPLVSTASGNFGLNSTGGAGAALKGTGYPQTWPGLETTTTGYPDFGAVQSQPTSSGGSGGSFVFGN